MQMLLIQMLLARNQKMPRWKLLESRSLLILLLELICFKETWLRIKRTN